MMIKTKKIQYVVMYFLICIVCNLCAYLTSSNNILALKNLGILCLIELIAFIFLNKAVLGKYMNFSLVFIVVLFIFNFGQVMILTFFHDVYPHVRFLLLLDSGDALYGFRIINLSFSLICLGILMAEIFSENKVKLIKENHLSNEYNWRKIAIQIISVTFPIKLILDIITLYISISAGGTVARTWVNSFSNVLLYYGKISLVGFALLLISMKGRPQKQTSLFVIIEFYILLMMISGIRSENVGYVLVFAFLYFASRMKRMSIIRIIMYGLLGVIVLSFISAIGIFRTLQDKNIVKLYELFNMYLTKKNVILFLFDICGDTGYTALCVLTKWLPNYPPSYGNAYYLGWTAIIPSIFGIAGEITTKSCFALELQLKGTLAKNYYNIGGSILGELYFNFGVIGGIIASILLGFLIGWISKKCTYALNNNKYEKLIFIIPTMFASIYWIRDYFGGRIREAVWGAVFCWLVIKISENKIYIKD